VHIGVRLRASESVSNRTLLSAFSRAQTHKLRPFELRCDPMELPGDRWRDTQERGEPTTYKLCSSQSMGLAIGIGVDRALARTRSALLPCSLARWA